MSTPRLQMTSFILFLGFAASANAKAAITFGDASEIVALTLSSNAAAKTYDEWHESGLHSQESFARLLELSRNSSASKKNVCRALKALNGEDLAIFQNELENSDLNASDLPCVKELRNKVKAFYTISNIEMVSAATKAGAKGLKSSGPVKTADLEVDLSTSPVFFDGGLKAGEIALTFDDGPHPSRTDRLLAILHEFDAKATFFQVGQNAEKYPEIARRVREAGHTVGSHSHNHAQLSSLSTESGHDNLKLGAKEVSEALGLPAFFFRFPFGARTKALQSLVKEDGFATFFWNIDTLDWKYRNPSVLFPYAIKELNASGGKGIVLFHDIQEQTISVIRDFIAELRERGYTLVRFVDPEQEKALRR